MRPRVDPAPALISLAAAQAGVLSVEQTELFGLGRHSRSRLLESGRWRRLEGPILHTLPTEPEWLSYAWGGILLGGGSSRLGGSAAGYLHGLVPEPPDQITVLVPKSKPIRDRYPWEFRREQAGLRSSTSPGSPPRLTVEDTVLDLCEGADVAAIVDLLTLAVNTRHTTARRIRTVLAQRPRHSRRQLLEEILGDVAIGVRSTLEHRYLRDVERAHGLPVGRRQQRAGRPELRDVVYEAYRLVVELDGRLGHTGLGSFRDMRRDNVATVQGEASLRYGTRDVAGLPCAVAWQVAGVLIDRGWPGFPTSCTNCADVPLEEWAMV